MQKYEKSFVDRPDAHPSVILDIVTDDGENVVRELPIHEPVKTFYERDYNTYQIRIEEGEIVSIYRINHIPETGECCDNLVAKFFDGDLTAKYKLAQLLCVELEKNS